MAAEYNRDCQRVFARCYLAGNAPALVVTLRGKLTLYIAAPGADGVQVPIKGSRCVSNAEDVTDSPSDVHDDFGISLVFIVAMPELATLSIAPAVYLASSSRET
jgi:hypothetical protein